MTIPIAALPDHDKAKDPIWQSLFHSYRHIITPLRYNGWATDFVTGGAQDFIRADLADGTELIIASEGSLAANPDANKGWVVLRQRVEQSPEYTVLYDSTPACAQSHHGNSLVPMFLYIEKAVPKPSVQLSNRTTHAGPYGAPRHVAGKDESPGMAVARFYGLARCLEAVEGYRRVWERPLEEGYPHAVFAKGASVVITRVVRSHD